MTSKLAHRVYHGIADDHDGTNARILVMDDGSGPTERKRANVLYQLAPEDPFWWGYSGGSPSRTAAAILDDVLPDVVPDVVTGSTPADMPRELGQLLHLAFIQDFLAYFHDDMEFWLPARTVVRWIHGVFREIEKS